MESIVWLILLTMGLAVFIWWMRHTSRPSPVGTPGVPTPPPGAPTPNILCSHGPLAGHTFSFKQTWLTIGRDPDNVIVIDGPLVSRRHAMLTATPNGIILSDLGSANGTWIAGRRVMEHSLNENEAFQIGPCIFTLAFPGRAAAPQNAPQPISQPVPDVSISMARSVEINSYERLELIGKGGAAFVYKMRHRRTQDLAALKILKESADPYFKRRFGDEGSIGLQLAHPYIVTVYSSGEFHGIHYILMEYLAGGSLREQIGRLKPQQIVTIIGQICEALDFAHSRGVFHRDIKPENILFTQKGVAKLADFGIARFTGMRRITREGMIIGTPEYMSFEQAKGATIDGRSDQYALGVVLYEMLTGQPPFINRDPLKVVEMHLERTPIPPRQLNPGISAQAETVIMRALSKDKGRRYPTMTAMAAALGYQGAANMSRQLSRVQRPQAQARPARLVHLTTRRAWPLNQAEIILGREMLGESTVSRQHARIQQNGYAYTIEDLGSTNGTFVEGQRITSTTVLSPGARIHLGPVPFQFLVDELPSGRRRLT